MTDGGSGPQGGVSLSLECAECGYRLTGSASRAASFCPGCGHTLADHGAAPAPDGTSALRVLVVEDSTGLRRLVSGFARKQGHEVFEAHNGEEALRWMADEVPDLLITDHHMPEMTGMELLERMRADPRLRDVRSVMLSRESDAAFIRRAKALKVVDFIHKDHFYDPGDLEARLTPVLERYAG